MVENYDLPYSQQVPTHFFGIIVLLLVLLLLWKFAVLGTAVLPGQAGQVNRGETCVHSSCKRMQAVMLTKKVRLNAKKHSANREQIQLGLLNEYHKNRLQAVFVFIVRSRASYRELEDQLRKNDLEALDFLNAIPMFLILH